MALLVDPRRDIRLTSRPQLYSIGIATSKWCCDMKIFLLHISFSLDHISFVATSIFCCLSHPGRNLFLQVATSLTKVFYFFPKTDLGDVATWKLLKTKLPVTTLTFSCDFISACRLVSSGFC